MGRRARVRDHLKRRAVIESRERQREGTAGLSALRIIGISPCNSRMSQKDASKEDAESLYHPHSDSVTS